MKRCTPTLKTGGHDLVRWKSEFGSFSAGGDWVPTSIGAWKFHDSRAVVDTLNLNRPRSQVSRHEPGSLTLNQETQHIYRVAAYAFALCSGENGWEE